MCPTQYCVSVPYIKSLHIYSISMIHAYIHIFDLPVLFSIVLTLLPSLLPRPLLPPAPFFWDAFLPFSIFRILYLTIRSWITYEQDMFPYWEMSLFFVFRPHRNNSFSCCAKSFISETADSALCSFLVMAATSAVAASRKADSSASCLQQTSRKP